MILYLTEKASQIKALNAALKKAYGNNYKYELVPLSGHVLKLWEPKEYKDGPKVWKNFYTEGKVPFIPNEWKYKINDGSGYKERNTKLYNNAIEKIKKAKEVILATDPDNEGVLLGMEVIDSINASHKVIGMVNMSKLDVDSLSKEVKVINKLPWEKMYEAGRARAKGDYIYGHNSTLAATIILGNAIKSSDKKLINIGPVKSVIMNMVVQRHLENENFKNIPFWQLKGKITKDGKEFEVTLLLDGEDKFNKEEDAKKIFEKIKGTKGIITNYKETEKKKTPPLPLHLGDLQILMGRKFNINDKKTLEYAQSLYDKEYQSYPRVDSNYYSTGEYNNAAGILNSMKNSIEEIKKLYNIIPNPDNPMKRTNVFNDKKIDGPHTALAPTINIPKSMSDNEKKVYLLVAGRYIEQFMDDYTYKSISINGKTTKENLTFKFTDSETIDLGFKKVNQILYNEKDENRVRKTPIFQKNEEFEFEKIWIHKGETKPKPLFTDATLIDAMSNIEKIFTDDEIKKNLKGIGIGTPATRANIKESLFKDKYFEYKTIKKKKYIISTNKAQEVVSIVPQEALSPLLRAKMEKMFKDIVQGTLTEKESIQYIIETTKEVIKKMELTAKNKNISLSGSSNKVETDIKCPLCNNNNLIKSDKGYFCKGRKYNPKTKKSTGCLFLLVKNSKPIEKILDDKDVKTLISGSKIVGKNGNKLLLDLKNPPYFTKVEWSSNNNSNNKLELLCPLCNNKLIETPKVFKCSNSKYDSKTKTSSGCKFTIFKEQKMIKKTLNLKDLEKLLNNKQILGNNNKLELDLNNKYFTKIIWGKK